MIRGAGELATYVKGTESLKSMMDLLTDYAAGMTGGGEVSPEQMESLATGLGMAYDGNYMAMRRKGFDTSKLEALDALAENGGVWGAKEKKKYGDVLDADLLRQARAAGGVTEQMRVDALKESLSDWQGLSGEVNKLDSSAIVRFQNKLGDLREDIGKKLYPVFNRLVGLIDKNLPKIQFFFDRIGDMFISLSDSIGFHLETLLEIGTHLAKVLPVVADIGLGLLKVVDVAVVRFVGFKEAIVALTSVIAVNTLVSYRKQVLAVGMDLKKTAVDFWKLRTELKFTRLEMVKSFGELGRAGLNKAFKNTTAQMLLFGAAVWGLEKILEAGKTAIDAFSESKKQEDMRNADAEHSMAVDEYTTADRQASTTLKALENFRKEHGFYSGGIGNEGYFRADGSAIVGLQNEDEFLYNAYMAANKAKLAAKAKLSAADAARELARERIFGKNPDGDKNPYLDSVDKIMKDLEKTGKTELHQTFNTTNIEQKVNVAAEVEKIGMLLNFSVRAAIEQAMRQNQNRMTAGAM